MSLRSRLLVAAAVVLAVMAANAVLVTAANRHFLLEQVDDQLRSAAGAVRRFQFGPQPGAQPGTQPAPFDPSTTPGSVPFPTGGTLPGGQAARPPRIDEGNRGTFSQLWVGVVETDGAVARVVAPGLGPAVDPVIDPDTARAAATSGQAFDVASANGDERFRVTAHTIGGDRVAVIGLSLARVDEANRQLALALASGALVMAALMALLGWWVWRLGLRPIRRVTEAADAIRSGDRDRRVEDYPAGTEVGAMAAALNTMLDEQKAGEDELRRFVGDASHELRSPLTSIHGYVDLYRRGGLEDREALDDAMRRIAEESTRMVALVDDLLLLARLDQSRPLAREEVDVAMVLRDAASDAAAIAAQRSLQLDVTEPLVLEGDEHRLRQVVAAVVTNALVHTPTDATIVLRGTPAAGGGVVIEIVDDGPGMAPEVAAHAFDRFFRGDPARSRDRGGSGLGLAIVHSVVTHHGGRVELDTAPGEGTTVRLVFPGAPHASAPVATAG